MGPLDISKLFQFDDLTPLDKLIAKTDELEKKYQSLIQSALDNSGKFSNALSEVVEQAKKLDAEVSGLDSTVKNQQKSIVAAANSAQELANAQKQLQDAQSKNNAIVVEGVKQQEKLGMAKKQLTKLTLEERLEQQEANRIAKLTIKSQKSQEGSVQQLRAQLGLLKIEWSQLSQEERENTTAGRKLEMQLADLNQEVKDLEKGVGITSRSVGDYTSSIVEAAGQINPLQVGTAGFGSALNGIVGSVPQLAAVGAAVGGISVAMDELQELSEEVRVELKQVSDLTGETGDNLLNLTGAIRASAETFDKDFNEVLRSANVLSKEFGLSQQEALNLVNEGLIRGADSGGDFLDQISEYSTQFARAGLDARGLINTIDFSVKEGIFSDKGADLIKEAGLRLSELTPAAQDALKPLGELTNQQIRAAVASGDTFEAIKLVASGIEDVNLSAQEVQTVIADVFGGPGEDAGLRFIGLLNEIDQGFKLTDESATEFQKSQMELLSAQNDLSNAQVKLGDTLKGASAGYKTLGLNIQTFFLNLIIKLLDVFRPLRDAFGELGDALGELADAFGLTGKEGESAIGVLDVLGASLQFSLIPLRLLIALYTGVIELIVDVVRSFGFFNEAIDESTEGVSFFQEAIENLPAFLSGLVAAFKQSIIGIKDLIVNTFSNVSDIISGALTFDVGTLRSGLSNLKKPFGEFGKEVADAYNNAFAKEREKGLDEDAARFDKSNEDQLKSQREFAQKQTIEAAESNRKRADQLKKATFELNKFRVEQEIKTLEKIASDEEMILASRLRAISDAADKRIDLAKLERDELLREEGLTAAGRQLILEQFAAKVNEIESEADLKVELIIEADTKKAEDDLKKLFDQTFKQRIQQNDKELAERLKQANDQFANDEITLVEFEQRKLDIQSEFHDKRLQDQLAFFKNQLQLLNLSADERLEVERKIAEAELAIADKGNQDKIQRERDLQAKIQEIKQVAFDAGLVILDNINAAEDEKRARDLEKIEQQREIELALAGNNEERKAEIQAEFDARRQEVEADQRKADRRRAIFEKGLAATQIAIDTAVAVVKALRNPPGPPFSVPQAIATGALGAIQLAAVLSAPIPQFYKGTKNAPEGWALINELGSEIVEDPTTGKRMMAHTDGPALAYLKQGSKVYTHEESKRILEEERFKTLHGTLESGHTHIIQSRSDGSEKLITVMSSKMDSLEHTIRHKKEAHIHLDRNLLSTFTKTGEIWTKIYNQDYF